jgi:hypothetical protein
MIAHRTALFMGVLGLGREVAWKYVVANEAIF